MEWVILGFLALVWLMSPIILLAALVVARRRVRELQQRPVARSVAEPSSLPGVAAPIMSSGPRYALADLENLLLLRLELQRLADSGDLPEARWRRLSDELDRRWQQHLRAGGASPDDAAWRARRALAWNLLARESAAPPGPPPWATVEVAAPTPHPASAGREEPALPLAPLEMPPVAPVEPQPPLPPSPVPAIRRKPVQPPAPIAVEPSVPATDWRPTAPNPLERVLQALSGWPKLIAPFLAQNIGWFIGGFCFVAGALFLIANTTGFVNALTVFASLFSATAFLMWAGYQFRRQRPELAAASAMLLTLAMLLAPLDLAVAVRLISASAGHSGLWVLSLVIAASTLAAFAGAALLVSGLMDRALMERYPWVLTALAGVQLAAPLAKVLLPDWPALAVLQGVLLGLLGYGLRTFSREWLRRLFVERRLTTGYAAGLLVYTAGVSFVHLTWIWPAALPAGYAGPVLMALCGLLFPVDAAFKDWVHKYTFLSRFSFALYGLSVVAIAIAAQALPTVLVTLAMGAALYGWVTWRYRTLPPLYLLLGCVAGLYGYGVLYPLSPAWRGLASLPALLALLGLCHWAGSRSPAIARQGLLLLGLLLVGLTVWSLIWTTPGGLGFATAATAALLAYAAVRQALALPDADPRWAWANSGVVALATVAVSYAPAWAPLLWESRTAFGLVALAALWAGLGLHDRRQPPISRRVFIAGALLNVAMALAFAGWAAWPTLFGQWEPILLLALAGTLLLWLSLGLRQQPLFYAVLACAAGLGVLVKHGYFPEPSTGLGHFIAVIVLWGFLWRLERRERWRAALGSERDVDPVVMLVRVPLEQAMALLWVVGLIHLGQRGGAGAINGPWLAATGLAMLSGLLLVGYFHRFRWTMAPLLLGLAGLLMELDRTGWSAPWLSAAAVGYALLIWRLGGAMLKQSWSGRLARILCFTTARGGGRQQTMDSLRDGALLITVSVVAASPALVLTGWPAPHLWPTWTLSLLLFGLTGWRDRAGSHGYAALITLTVGVWLTGVWLTPAVWIGLGQPLSNTLLSLFMALAAGGRAMERAAPLGYWRGPLVVMSGLLYGLALTGALLGFWAADPRLPGLLAVLGLALFPVARFWPNAADWRGLGLALLLSALVASLADATGVTMREAVGLAILWGYALWASGNLWWPRWNRCWPDWAVAPALWPLFGLASVLSGAVVGVLDSALSPAGALAGLALYLFLLLRNTTWPGLAWLAAAALTASVLLASGSLHWTWWGRAPVAALNGEFAAALLGLNLLWLLVPLWRQRGERIAQALRWRQSALEAPLFWMPFAALLALLTRLLLVEAGGLLWDGAFRLERSLSWSLSGVTLLLAVTTGHAFRLRSTPLTAHTLLLALGALIPAVLLDVAAPLVWLPLAAALWHGALLLAWRYGPLPWIVWRQALDGWLTALPIASLGLLVVVADGHWMLCALTLLTLAATTLARGWRQGETVSLKAGLALALAGGYSLWLPETGTLLTALVQASPGCALQTVLLWLLLTAVRRGLDQRVDRLTAGADVDRERLARFCHLEQTLGEMNPWLPALSLLWLGLHGYAVLAYLAGGEPAPWYFGRTVDALMASATLIVLAGVTAVRARQRPDEPNWIYATALLLGLLAGYGRLLTLGLTLFSVGDTTALMAAGYAAFLLHQFTGLTPLYRLALWLPLWALATAPWQLASPWTGGTLLAAAVLYLALAGALRNPLPLYLGVLALNGTIYLWAPLWAGRYGLWQFYLIPAAASVLVLLHLHRRELRPKVLNGARLAALSTLYAGAGLDVFLRPELWIFVLALGLALLGIVVGVALRIRAFLYAGVAFLVLNVIGQLLRFYPDQSLSRALILLGLGAAITAGMVAFNLKREAILQRVRLIRADLAGWE